MVQFLNIDGYQVQQHKEELEFIISHVLGKTNYMEIGVFGGGTFNYVSKHIKGKHIAVDMKIEEAVQERLKQTVKNCHIVIGDTHDYKTVKEVKTVLNGETVDVLFIDGDHSAEGVERDYQMYKQFVSNNGLIFFHDIIKSEFHTKHKCFVDVFWDKAPNPKYSISVSNEWGGVGMIINKKVYWKCYQIYFKEEQKNFLLPIFEHYDNSDDKTFDFFENRIIKKIYDNLKNEEADYVGTTSWKFMQKTKFNAEIFMEVVEATNCNYNVLLFPHHNFVEENCIERNKKFYTPIYQLCEIIDKEQILPLNLEHDKWTCSYCNYWIAKKEVYKDYCERVLFPIMKAFEKNKTIKKFVKNNPFKYNNRDYPLTPFILELLMGFYINKYNINHSIIKYNDAKISNLEKPLKHIKTLEEKRNNQFIDCGIVKLKYEPKR